MWVLECAMCSNGVCKVSAMFHVWCIAGKTWNSESISYSWKAKQTQEWHSALGQEKIFSSIIHEGFLEQYFAKGKRNTCEGWEQVQKEYKKCSIAFNCTMAWDGGTHTQLTYSYTHLGNTCTQMPAQMYVDCPCVWQKKLSRWIREQRLIGIPVQIWMMKEESIEIHKQMYPRLWNKTEPPFTVSRTHWLSPFISHSHTHM